MAMTELNTWLDLYLNSLRLTYRTNDNDYYRGSGKNDGIYGLDGDDTLFGRGGHDYLEGNAGNDILKGGSGNDALLGGEGDDSLYGGRHDDLLIGGEGADFLNGGKNNDTASYETATAGVTISLAQADGSMVLNFSSGPYTLAASGDAAGDTLKNIENLTGSDFTDFLQGDAGVNIITGGDGDDYLDGGEGADILIGGEGNDIALYLNSDEAITLDFVNQTASGGIAEGDTLDSIEGVMATAFDDFIIAGQEENYIDGMEGIDTVSYALSDAGVSIDLASQVYSDVGSGGFAEGDDILGVERFIGSNFDDLLSTDGRVVFFDGGAGNDTLSFGGAQSSVTVDLMTGNHSGAYAENITLENIENITGSSYADVLIGDDGDNIITARGGIETAYMNQVAADDILTGNGGSDTFVFQTISNYNVITDLDVNEDKIQLNYDGLDSIDDLEFTEVTNDYGSGLEITSDFMVSSVTGEVDTVFLLGLDLNDVGDIDVFF